MVGDVVARIKVSASIQINSHDFPYHHDCGETEDFKVVDEIEISSIKSEHMCFECRETEVVNAVSPQIWIRDWIALRRRCG